MRVCSTDTLSLLNRKKTLDEAFAMFTKWEEKLGSYSA
jgi:hypothetical protein